VSQKPRQLPQLIHLTKMKSFKQFNEEIVKPVVITFGRFNPPTVGHGKLFKKVASVAKGNDYRIHASQSNDPKKNPLKYNDKVKFLRKMFPEHGRSIILDTSIKNIFSAASKAYEDGYSKLIVVVGDDRVGEFKQTLVKYNGVKGRHGFYDFEYGIEIKSAGVRDPDSDDAVEAMSASKMRNAAADNDLKTFTLGMPKNFRGTAELMNAVRKGMGLKESTNFRKHFELETNSIRERYISGEIFNVGDKVINKKDNQEYTITEKFTNHVSIKNKQFTVKAFIQDLDVIKN